MSRLRTVRLLWGVGLTAVAVLVTLRLVFPHRPRANSEELVKEGLPRNLVPATGRANIRYSTNGTAETEELAEVGECLRNHHLTPWFRAQDWPETCLVFYGKPIMLVLKSISRQRHWRVKLILKDSPAGLEDLQSLVSSDRFLVLITNSRAYRHRIIRELSNSTNAMVSTIENAHKVTGAKRTQLSVFRDHFKLFGCSLEEADIMPRSFVLSDPTQCVQFFKYGNAHPKTWWVLKPSDGYGGDGITIHSNLSTLYKEYGTCTKHDDYIVQEYLPDLLLLQNRKFDIRALILISGTSPYLLFHHEGYLRVSVREFDLHGGREVHLTNSHVQFTAEGFQVNKHFWSFQQLQDYLNENHPDNNEFVSNKLIPFIQKISLFILQSGQFSECLLSDGLLHFPPYFLPFQLPSNSLLSLSSTLTVYSPFTCPTALPYPL